MDENLTINSRNAEHHLSQSVVADLLHSQIRSSIAPIGLEIDCLALDAWAKFHGHTHFEHISLVHELKAWGPLCSARPLSQVWVNRPFTIMDAPGLTQLVYAIGQSFKVIRGHHVEHATSLSLDDIERANIALLKGLNFNHIQLICDSPLSLAKIEACVTTIREFKFPWLSLMIHLPEHNDQGVDALMELLDLTQPQAVAFNRTPEMLIHLGSDSVAELLNQYGYYLHNNHSLIRFHSTLHPKPTDVVRLGPGAYSHLAGIQAVNFDQPDAYFERVNHRQLPVARLS